MNPRNTSLFLAVTTGVFGCASQRPASGQFYAPGATVSAGRAPAPITMSESGGDSAPPPPPSVAPESGATAGAGVAQSAYRQPAANTSNVGSYHTPPSGRSAPSSAPAQPSAPVSQVSPVSQQGGGAASRVSLTTRVQVDGDPRSQTPTAEQPPATRQGLATEWGETRASNVGYTSFTRASATPFDTAAIYYNDASGVAAQASYRASQSPVLFAGAYHDGVRVSLRGEAGSPLPGYVVNERLYVLGTGGQRYTVLLENNTSVRIEAVVSVDGLDVINGRAASMGFRGYIIPAHGSIAVDGFRQDQGHVAAFRFGAVGDSYAAQTGSARNVGVIGVALFSEYGVPLPSYDAQEVHTRETANPFPGGYATPPARRNYE